MVLVDFLILFLFLATLSNAAKILEYVTLCEHIRLLLFFSNYLGVKLLGLMGIVSL